MTRAWEVNHLHSLDMCFIAKCYMTRGCYRVTQRNMRQQEVIATSTENFKMTTGFGGHCWYSFRSEKSMRLHWSSIWRPSVWTQQKALDVGSASEARLQAVVMKVDENAWNPQWKLMEPLKNPLELMAFRPAVICNWDLIPFRSWTCWTGCWVVN